MEDPFLYRDPNLLFPLEDNSGETLSTCYDREHNFQRGGFYKLYSITISRKNDSSQSESSRVKGLNSPWGTRASICAHFSWTYDYLLWGISWLNVQMFLSDLPSYESGKKGEDSFHQVENKEDLQAYLVTLMQK